MVIIPAIITDSIDQVKQKVRQAEKLFQRVQIDFDDGAFGENRTIEPKDLENIETNLVFDAHLMVDEPINWIEKLGETRTDRIIGQIEKMSDQLEFVSKVHESGRKVGLAIDLFTGVQEISPAILKDLEIVLVMSVHAGHGGQEFESIALEKIRELKKIREEGGYQYSICSDGGINKDIFKNVQEAGADEVVVGSFLFEGEIKQNLEILLAQVTSDK